MARYNNFKTKIGNTNLNVVFNNQMNLRFASACDFKVRTGEDLISHSSPYIDISLNKLNNMLMDEMINEELDDLLINRLMLFIIDGNIVLVLRRPINSSLYNKYIARVKRNESDINLCTFSSKFEIDKFESEVTFGEDDKESVKFKNLIKINSIKIHSNYDKPITLKTFELYPERESELHSSGLIYDPCFTSNRISIENIEDIEKDIINNSIRFIKFSKEVLLMIIRNELIHSDMYKDYINNVRDEQKIVKENNETKQ